VKEKDFEKRERVRERERERERQRQNKEVPTGCRGEGEEVSPMEGSLSSRGGRTHRGAFEPLAQPSRW
jgi:hypothetical protein